MPSYTRREFAKIALAALPAAGVLSQLSSLRAADPAATGRPNSKVKGVQIGLNVPYSFSSPTMSGDEIIKNCVALGVSGVELRAQPVEAFLGSPVPTAVAARGSAVNSDEAKANAAKLHEWRLGIKADQIKPFRKKFDDAGIAIEILKVDNITKMADGAIDYSFMMAKALGARAISTEIPRTDKPEDAGRVKEEIARLGRFADKHQIMVGFHGHTHSTEADFMAACALAKYNGINLDIGHYVAGGNGDVVEFIKKHHARITHVHIKDKKKWDPVAKKEGGNTPFGEGDTPIKDVLRLIRDNKWPIQATIEFEYKVPEGSTRMAEIAKTVQYCRDALA